MLDVGVLAAPEVLAAGAGGAMVEAAAGAVPAAAGAAMPLAEVLLLWLRVVLPVSAVVVVVDGFMV